MKWRWTRGREGIFFLAVTGLLLWPVLLNMDAIPFHPKAEFTDLLTSHWPNAHFLQVEISQRGQFPLWNPMILSGSPLVADPLFSVWYPPTWLAILMPTIFAFNALFILHLAWAGFGVFVLSRLEERSLNASLLAGIAFAGAPKLVGHIGLGHVGLVSAVAWTPWLLICLRGALRRTFEDEGGALRWAALSGGVLAIAFFADPRWLVPVAGLGISYGSYFILKRQSMKAVFQAAFLRAVGIFSITALGISSGLSLPLIEFLSRSTRADISAQVAANVHFPLHDLIKIFVPDFGGWPETLPYLGTFIFGFAILGVLSRARSWKFWLAVCAGSLLLALGDQTPIYLLIARVVPGLRFLRVPARFLLLFQFGMIMLAGLGYEFVFGVRRHLRLIRLTSFGYGAGIFLVGIMIHFLEVRNALAGPYMMITAVLFVLLIFGSKRGTKALNVISVLSIGAVVVELMIMSRSLLQMRPKELAFEENPSVRQNVPGDDELRRLFSPSYSIPQHVAALNFLQLADGVNPLQLDRYVTYMATAVGFSGDGYSVTLPPFPDGNPSSPQTFNLVAENLGYLNVEYVFSEYPLDAAALEFIDTTAGTHVYRNSQVRPRAWLEMETEGAQSWKEVDSIRWSPNEIIIRAHGPGLLVLSEVIYPGWVVTVDNNPSPISEYRRVFRAVPLEAGEHIIRFAFRPPRVYLGALFTLVTSLGLVWVWKRP